MCHECLVVSNEGGPGGRDCTTWSTGDLRRATSRHGLHLISCDLLQLEGSGSGTASPFPFNWRPLVAWVGVDSLARHQIRLFALSRVAHKRTVNNDLPHRDVTSSPSESTS